MRKVNAFVFSTLNGYYHGLRRDISWHRHGAEENAFSEEGFKADTILLFGRATYEMMASYWPTPAAITSLPRVAEGMNRAEKIVFSRTLKKVTWNNTRLVRKNIEDEIERMKQTPGKDMTILGSGSIVARLTERRLIDEYQIMLDPVVLGRGATLFGGLKQKLDLRLTGTRTFSSGVVLLTYEPL